MAADPDPHAAAARRPGAELRLQPGRHPDRPLLVRRLEPEPGQSPDGHLTLPNTTPTDLFCSAQIVLPGSSDALLLGGDNWIASTGATNNHGNNDSLIFRNHGDATA